MKEINNNIPNYGYKIDHIDTKKEIAAKTENKIVKDTEEYQYVPDTVGRSQVHYLKGGNIEKSVEEAVDIAENEPEVLLACENMYESLYQKYINEGCNEIDAAIKAMFGEEELREIIMANR